MAGYGVLIFLSWEKGKLCQGILRAEYISSCGWTEKRENETNESAVQQCSGLGRRKIRAIELHSANLLPPRHTENCQRLLRMDGRRNFWWGESSGWIWRRVFRTAEDGLHLWRSIATSVPHSKVRCGDATKNCTWGLGRSRPQDDRRNWLLKVWEHLSRDLRIGRLYRRLSRREKLGRVLMHQEVHTPPPHPPSWQAGSYQPLQEIWMIHGTIGWEEIGSSHKQWSLIAPSCQWSVIIEEIISPRSSYRVSRHTLAFSQAVAIADKRARRRRRQ